MSCLLRLKGDDLVPGTNCLLKFSQLPIPIQFLVFRLVRLTSHLLMLRFAAPIQSAVTYIRCQSRALELKGSCFGKLDLVYVLRLQLSALGQAIE